MSATCCRHCCRLVPDESSYAAVLVGNGERLGRVIESMETRIIPCITAVCPKCGRVSILSSGTTSSCVRTVATWRRLAEWIDT
jgi:hypothetical protein